MKRGKQKRHLCGLETICHGSGFTIVELLVVIVVVAILATITTISYNGVTKKAAVSNLQSGLRNAATKVALYSVDNGTYPANRAVAQAAGVIPSGGDITYQYSAVSNNYCLSVFSSQSGNSAYHLSSATGIIESGVCSGHVAPGGPTTVSVVALVVAGGGGGGSAAGLNCGGGGAGGLIFNDAFQIERNHDYSVVVGNGGTQETNGQNSSFSSLIAIGGGHGGCSTVPTIGGSGGGARCWDGTQAAGTIGQGYAGGVGNGANYGAGGGGGAAEPGNTNVAGAGGDGLGFDISGTLAYYGGGGGGGTSGGPSQLAPLGGGGRGAYYPNPAGNGLANFGGGGGGGSDGSTAGGIGGSGVIIIRYLTSSVIANGGTITADGDYTIHTFTSSGTFSVN